MLWLYLGLRIALGRDFTKPNSNVRASELARFVSLSQSLSLSFFLSLSLFLADCLSLGPFPQSLLFFFSTCLELHHSFSFYRSFFLSRRLFSVSPLLALFLIQTPKHNSGLCRSWCAFCCKNCSLSPRVRNVKLLLEKVNLMLVFVYVLVLLHTCCEQTEHQSIRSDEPSGGTAKRSQGVLHQPSRALKALDSQVVFTASRVAQWKRAGPITQRSVDRNHALLTIFFSDFLINWDPLQKFATEDPINVNWGYVFFCLFVFLLFVRFILRSVLVQI